MADTNPAAKHPPAATVEDCADTDDEKGDSSASKPASNSSTKRSRKTLDPKRSSPSKARPASVTGPPEAPLPPGDTDAPSRQPEEPASQGGAKEEVSCEPGAKTSHRSRRPSQAPAPSSPGRVPREIRQDPERHRRERRPPNEPPCGCRDCMNASHHGTRPGPNPLQQDHRTHTFPARPPHGPPPIVRHGPPSGVMPPGHIPPPGARIVYSPGTTFAGCHPPPPEMMPRFDPRSQPMHSGMPPPLYPSMYAPSGVSMPPPLPGAGGPPPPMKLPIRPAIHHPERSKTTTSLPKRSSKISTYDTTSAPFSPDDDEHFSARNLPSKPQHMPGGFESDSYSSESPPDSPEYFKQPRRPATFHRATTSAVQQINRSGHTRSRSDYPAESAYGYHRAYPTEPAWDQNIHAGYSDHGDQRSYPGGRRGSNATTWTQHTSASDPQHPSYVHYNQHNFNNDEHAAIDYMNQARGHSEERITAEALRQLPGGPRSTRSNHSHRRSQHSMSETSSRHRGAEGSVKLIMSIAAAEDTRIQLSGDMGDREVSLRSTNDPGRVEVTIATVAGGESRYLKSASQTSRAPTRSSGSTRHATRGGAEGQEQGRSIRVLDILSLTAAGSDYFSDSNENDSQQKVLMRFMGFS
ncbi:hypothetical protein KCU81_g1964, partial [Aureobasidium melanogenum]|uniref:Uncharacterized protein n=1 Tax=Aureobasidium melanogenum (strain CBS 110374) TaxID=1043003 RepID=A0A074VP75_AURM1